MTKISVKNLTVEFKIYGSNSRSLKRQLFSQVTGGRVSSGADKVVHVTALDNISLEVNEGDRIGLIGHNGSGKTTLLRALAGIYKPSLGTIETTGKVGVLLNPSAGMDPEATGKENVYLRGYLLGMKKKEIDAKLDEVVEIAQIGDFLNLPMKTYSAGMYARLSFAISVIKKPEILLVDEGIGVADAAFKETFDKKLSDKT